VRPPGKVPALQRAPAGDAHYGPFVMNARADDGSADLLAYGTTRGRWVVAATVLGSGITGLDVTVVGIALPRIGRTFHCGLGTLQWVVTGYALTLAAFLLLGGSLGDRLGRRKMFAVGIVWFAVASACCGLAPNAATLIAARIVQGVGGALLAPASLAILEASFRPEDRARAIGAWSGLGGLASAAGPFVGGYLIAAGSWRYVFDINLPVAVAVLAITMRHVPESRDPTTTGRVDVAGACLAVVFLAGLTYGLIEEPARGWGSPVVISALIVAAAALPGFLAVERFGRSPMLPLSVFRSGQFSAANAVTFVVYGALGGTLFLLPVELQVVAQYSPLASGLALLPVTFIMLAFSARSGRLAAQIGPRLQMAAGPVVIGAGLILLTRATHSGSYLTLVFPAVMVFGAGLAITVAPLTATAMGAAPQEHAGVASAVNNVVARAAGLVAVAVLPLLAGITGGAALQASHFAAGFRVAVVIAGFTSVAGGLLAAITIRNPPIAIRRITPHLRKWHCAVDGAPLQAAVAPGTSEP
jgi:EmrB/QacA subfamily drug resistance transporter